MAGLRPRARGHAGRDDRPRLRRRPADRGDRHRHQALDRAPPRRSAARASSCIRATSPPRSCSTATPTSSSSPTAPATRRRSTTSSQAVRGVVGKRPVWGICLGHQLLCRAVGLETFKLPFGHRGANHPVKDLETRKIEITSQNHGFAVRRPGGARAIDTVRAGALGDRLRRRPAHPRQPLRPHRRGPHAARRPRGDGPVPPRGRARPERRALPLRPLPERRKAGV